MPRARDPKPSPLMKPFVVLALPGMYLFYKYNQFKRKRKENATRRLAERELVQLNNKIEELLAIIEAHEQTAARFPEEECVICINARANMLTVPCGHQVVCRRCFVKTIQNAVAQRLLPLRCVICRSKIMRLRTSHLPTSASGYSMDSAASSVPQSDSLYSVSSGGSSISSTSCSSDINKGLPVPCCGGHCSGAYPRQPTTGAMKRSQQHAMKMKIQDYCRPDKTHVNRLPPIKELPGQSPLHVAPPASTRIRCAQKILTQLELPILKSKGSKYEKLPQEDEEEKVANRDKSPEAEKRWWSDKKRDRTKSEEKIDNKKNELVEKQMELKEKLVAKADKITEKNKQNIVEEQL